MAVEQIAQLQPEQRWRKADFSMPALECAHRLIGATFLWDGCGGIVVETEAYAEHGDEACHTFVRHRARDFVQQQSAGTIYVYLNYGVHWLFNVLTKHRDSNGFILLRAIEPTTGIETMQRRRGRESLRELCSGPGKLTQAMGITPACHTGSIVSPDKPAQRGFFGHDDCEVVTDTRIGITKAAELPWRFLLKDSPFVSRKIRS
ncbi:DNA-3-methyladenine glycosylase [Aureliella helgolandensis]|uniref:Putative 3-methyladenine DNA glycosylase n=1 Tax=Aureliella helgolandensis TaxID=2527968 RepID=A0A518G4V8_9BACT|nr:DNA-3-methyladenine glycosylase [Aureliella helgolandensis]QDV23612.1 3-methyladenine DNA glycosylase [Aureliella helgolandensis]